MSRAPGRILVIALRRLGDVLLTTPLIRSLKRAWPAAEIDALVFEGTPGVLAGNPDLADVVAISARPSVGEMIALLRKLWRRYDLAFSTQSGDRPTFYAWAAGRRSVGFVEGGNVSARLKRLSLTHPIEVVPNNHRVREVLRLVEPFGIAPIAEVVAPRSSQGGATQPRPYAVIHAAPMFSYKRWTDEGWRALATALAARGLAIMATGGPGDKAELDALWVARPDIKRLDGALSWPALATLIRGASVYVGPDTSVTHLAAATGAPTVALFGPTDPQLWGPWPVGGLDPVWDAAGTIQTRGNVWLVQNPLPCLPCQQEGCLRRLDSYSRCLDELPLRQVLDAVDAALAKSAAA